MAWNTLMSRKSQRRFQPRFEFLEDRTVPSTTATTFAGNAQHTSIYDVPAQNLNLIHWQHTIDENSGAFAHYGAPLISLSNTVFTPVKIAGNHFRVDALNAADGTTKYFLTTDYVLPSFSWIPVYQPVLATGSFGTRLYYAGIGGTVYYIDNPDSASHPPPVQVAFYGTHTSGFDTTVFINTPLTADTNGNIFFGFRTQGTAPAPLNTTQSGFARIGADGSVSYVLAGTAAGDGLIGRDTHNSAPALSNDQTTLYVAVKHATSDNYGYLLGLDANDLHTKYKVFLNDPRNTNGANINDLSTASPTVGPDGDVYFGVLSNPGNGSRGVLLHFSGDLTVKKTPGGFGWDYTPAIVPASMVPGYTGTSSYLLFAKYNNYAISDGDGVNKIALLDPNATQIDPHTATAGTNLVEMREVYTIIGPTPDWQGTSYPNAMREWCINAAAVNPATNSVFFDSEDGRLYRWNLTTNQLSQQVALTPGIGEPYVPTAMGPDGTLYSLNGSFLFAIGGLNNVGVTVNSSSPDLRNVVVGQSLTFTAAVTGSGATPTGTVTFQDETHFLDPSTHILQTVVTTLASNVPLDGTGHASVTTSSLTADQHFINAIYSGDPNYSGGTARMVQKVHAFATTTTVLSSVNPSNLGQSVTFTANVASAGGTPTGMVTFMEGNTVLAQKALSSGSTSFSTSALGVGSHIITAAYYSDIKFAASSGNVAQVVRVSTSTSLASSPNPSNFGQSATFTATVTSSGGVPAGNVTFFEGATVLASAVPVDGAGHASFSTFSLGVGSHTVTATFNGNTGWLTSSGNTTHTVRDATSTSVTGSPNPVHFGNPVTFTATVTANDAGAGTPSGSVTFTEGATVLAANVPVDGTGQAAFTTSGLSFGSHVITATFTGATGWLSSNANSPTEVVQDGTSTSVISAPNPSDFNQSVTVTATVVGASAGTPTGTVTFTEGVAVLAANVAVDGSGQASFSTSALGVGSHVITASFTGTGGWLNSSGNSPAQVVRENTTTTVSSTPSPAGYGQAVTVTATVTAIDAGAGVPTGSVTFTEGATVLASGVAVDAGGHASFSPLALAVGSHTITATFTGTTGWQTSNGSTSQEVTDGTITTVASSPNPSAFGGAVTFTATVVAADNGAGVPTGAVTFAEGAAVLASNVAVDAGGQASFDTASLSVGSHVITATFTGSGGWQDSAGSSPAQLVQNGTSTAVSGSPSPSAFGSTVTFTATVTAADSGAGVPAGTVTFTDGATVLASGVPVDGAGHASVSTAALGVGSHTITASFTGTGGWQDSSGNSAAQIVQDGTTTTLDSSANPSDFSKSVTFTATVSAADAGAGVPTGTVTFTEGASVLAANVPVDSSGHAAFSTVDLSMGSHTITATFTGDTGWGGSSASLDQEINEETSTTVSTNPPVAGFGQVVTFTATIAVEVPAAGTPTGTVTFTEGATTLAVAPVDSEGHAVYATSSLSVGTHDVTASFTGTNGFEDSSGVSGPVQVQDGTTTSVVSAPNPSNFSQSVTFTATVSAADAGAGVPAGSVTFKEGATVLAANVPVDGAGHASFSTSSLAVGSHTITASFTGSGGWLDSSTSAAPQVVRPILTINDVSVTEGNSGTKNVTFTVTLTPSSSQTVTVAYATQNGTAVAPDDYQTASGTLTFTAGVTTRTFTVKVVGDVLDELDETFFVNLSNPTGGAGISDSQGVGTIVDNDASSIKINDISVTESDSGTVAANFAVTLSTPNDHLITANFATAAGTATSGVDYQATSGTVSFAPGASTGTATVLVNGDIIDEVNETFFVNLSGATGGVTISDAQGKGTIVDNDTTQISINDVSHTEGQSGTTPYVFTISLSLASSTAVKVKYASANNTAAAPTDYTAVSGTLTFNAGELTKTVTVNVKGDVTVEPDETFFLNLTSSPTNTQIADNQGLGTIVNDDGAVGPALVQAAHFSPTSRVAEQPVAGLSSTPAPSAHVVDAIFSAPSAAQLGTPLARQSPASSSHIWTITSALDAIFDERDLLGEKT